MQARILAGGLFLVLVTLLPVANAGPVINTSAAAELEPSLDVPYAIAAAFIPVDEATGFGVFEGPVVPPPGFPPGGIVIGDPVGGATDYVAQALESGVSTQSSASNHACQPSIIASINAVCADVFTDNSFTAPGNCPTTPGPGFECRRYYHAWSAMTNLGGLHMIMEGTHKSDSTFDQAIGLTLAAFHSEDYTYPQIHSTSDPLCSWARTDASNTLIGGRVRPVAQVGSPSVCGQT